MKLTQLALRHGPNLLFEHASFSLALGHKVGLTGRNGCGKSSLFSLILGELQADEGDFHLSSDWVIAHVAQEIESTDKAAVEYVIDGDQALRAIQAQLQQAEAQNDAHAIAHCHERLLEMEGYQAESRAAKLLSGLSFKPEQIHLPVSHFSGGWQMRLNLARALMCRSELLLLDEPTNHLDLDAVIWLEQWLKQYSGALMLISHDREFLDAVVNRIIHIEQHQLKEYTGNYTEFESRRAEQLAQQQGDFEKQQKTRAHLQSFVDRFKAKATKAKQAQSRIKALERMTLIAPAHIDSPFNFSFFKPKELPPQLMSLQNVDAGYADKTVLKNVNHSVLSGQRIGLLGLNGAGKSTLIKCLAGDLKPQAGRIETAKGLQVGYFAQHQLEQLDLEASALTQLQRIAPKSSEKELRTYLGSFNFQGDKVLQPITPFSGGEKARLVLALIIWNKPNLLLLDEPTNHLDIEMRLALNTALQQFEGTVVLVSHDRHLLKTVCDELWLVNQGRVDVFKDEIDDYPKWLAQQKDGTNKKPNRTKASPQGADRKQQKQQQAELRKQCQPHQNRLKRIEREVDKLDQRQSKLEQQLADPDLYQDANKDTLNNLLFDQAEIKKQKEELELEWFELSERIETLLNAE